MTSVSFDTPSDSRPDGVTPSISNEPHAGSLYGGGGAGGKARRNRRSTVQAPYKRPDTGRHAAAGPVAAAIATAVHNQSLDGEGSARNGLSDGTDSTRALNPATGNGGKSQSGSQGWMSRWSVGSLKSLVKWPWGQGVKPAAALQGASVTGQGGAAAEGTAVDAGEHQEVAVAGNGTRAEPKAENLNPSADEIIKNLQTMPMPEMEQIFSFLQYKMAKPSPLKQLPAAPGFKSPERSAGSQMMPFGEHRSIFTTPRSLGAGALAVGRQEGLPAGSAEKFHTPTGSGPDEELDPVEMARTWMGTPMALTAPTPSPKPLPRPGSMYSTRIREGGAEGERRGEGEGRELQLQVQREVWPGRSFLTQTNQGEGSANGGLTVSRWAPATEAPTGGRELLKRRRSVLDAGWAAPPQGRRMRVKPSYPTQTAGVRRSTPLPRLTDSPVDGAAAAGGRSGEGAEEGAREGGTGGGSWVGGRGVGSLVPSENNLTAKRILEMLDRYSSPPTGRSPVGRLEAGRGGGVGTSGGGVSQSNLLPASLNERGRRSMVEVGDLPPPVNSVEAEVAGNRGGGGGGGGAGGSGSGSGREVPPSTPAQFRAVSQAIEMALGGDEPSEQVPKKSSGFRFGLADDVEAVSAPTTSAAAPLSPPRNGILSLSKPGGPALATSSTAGNGSAKGFSFSTGMGAANESVPAALNAPPGNSLFSDAPAGAVQKSSPSEEEGVPKFSFGNSGVKFKGPSESEERSLTGGKEPEFTFTSPGTTVRPVKSSTSPPVGPTANHSPTQRLADPSLPPTFTPSQPVLGASLFSLPPPANPPPSFTRTSDPPGGNAAANSGTTVGTLFNFGASSAAGSAVPAGSWSPSSAPSFTPTPETSAAPTAATPPLAPPTGTGTGTGIKASRGTGSSIFSFGVAAAPAPGLGATGGFTPLLGASNPPAAGFGTEGGNWDTEGGERAGKRSARSLETNENETSKEGGVAGGSGGSQGATLGVGWPASTSPFSPTSAGQEISTAAPATSGFAFAAGGSSPSAGGGGTSPSPFSFPTSSKPAVSPAEAAAPAPLNPFGAPSSGSQPSQSVFGSSPPPIFGGGSAPSPTPAPSPSPSPSPWPAPAFGSTGSNTSDPAPASAPSPTPAPASLFGAPPSPTGFSVPPFNPFGPPMTTTPAFGGGGFPPQASPASAASPFLFASTPATPPPSTTPFTFNAKPALQTPPAAVFGGFGSSSSAPAFGALASGGGSLGMEDSMSEDPFSPTRAGGNVGAFSPSPTSQQQPQPPATFMFQQQQSQQQVGAPGVPFAFGAVGTQPQSQPQPTLGATNPFVPGVQMAQGMANPFGGAPGQGMANPFGGEAGKPLGGMTFAVGGGGDDKAVRRVVKAKRPGGVRRK